VGLQADSLWQAKDYKAFPPSMDMTNVQFDSMPAIQDMPVTSAICEPSDGSTLIADKDGEIKLKGFAWSGGGKAIARVDVSADGGDTWHVAELTHQPDDPTPSKTRSWGWSLWSAIVPIPAVKTASGEVPVQLTCKAVDIDYNTQPENPVTVWNFRGLVNNSFHRVNVTVKREDA
jgi:sulfite oxidase